LDIPNPSSLANQSQEVITNVEKIGIEDNESKDTDFQSGRIEVNENTYAELKSKSVNTIGNSGVLTEEQVNSRLAEVENTDSNIEESEVKLPSKSNEGQKQKDLTSGKEEAKIDGSNEVQSTEVTVDDDIKETLANDPTETELKMMRATKGEDSSVNISKELPDVAPSKAVNTESNIVSNISKEENEAPLLDNTPSYTDSEGNSSVVALSHDVDINTDIYTDQNNRESSGRLEYIQAGAFRNILNAHKLRNSLYSEMEKVLLVEESEENLCDGKKLYKVLLGPVTDSKERKIFTQVLEEQGIKSFSVLK